MSTQGSTARAQHPRLTAGESDDASMALLTLDEVAARLNLSKPSIYRMIGDGRLPVVRFGRSVRFRPADVDALIAASVAAPDPDAAGPRAGLGWATVAR